MSDENEELTWEKLAIALGTTRRSLSEWRAKYDDAPQQRTVAKWRAFMKERGLQAYSMRMNMPCAPAEDGPEKDHESIASLIADMDFAKARIVWRLRHFPDESRERATAALAIISKNVRNLYECVGSPEESLD
jgi:hypothetical protein